MQYEVVMYHIPNTLSNGPELVAEDFIRPLDRAVIPDAPRPRYISHLFQILSIKFRIWLFNFIPPHPSFNLSWIFSLISLLFLYKFVCNFTNNRYMGWIALILYLASPGFLSGFTFWAHSGKPLSNFFVIILLYLASKVKVLGLDSKRGWITFISLLFILLIAFFTDETAFFIFPAIPLFFPDIFINNSYTRKKTILISGLYLCSFIIFLLMITFLMPYLSEHYIHRPFDFWSYVFKGHEADPRVKNMLDSLQPMNFLYYAYGLIFSHIVFFTKNIPVAFNEVPEIHIGLSQFIYIGLLMSYFVFLVFKLYNSKKSRFSFNTLMTYNKNILFLRISIILLLYLIFLVLIQATHPVRIPQGYYYGTTFSIFFAIFLSFLLSIEGRIKGVINKIILVFIIIISLTNFFTLNHWWIDRKNRRYNYKLISKAWNNRYNKSELLKIYEKIKHWYPNYEVYYAELKSRNFLIEGFPVEIDWLFHELEYITGRRGPKRKYEVTSSDSGENGAKNIFVKNVNIFWETGKPFPHWLQIDFKEKEQMKLYTLKTGSHGIGSNIRMPKEWELQGSDDKKNWVVLDNQINQTHWYNNEIREYNIGSPQEHRYYRLYFTKGNSNVLRIYEIDFIENKLNKNWRLPGLEYITEGLSFVTNEEIKLNKINNNNKSFLKLKVPFPNLIQIDSKNKKRMQGYAIQSGQHAWMPKAWYLQGSIDKNNWVVLDKQQNQINWGDTEERIFKLSSPNNYRYYRFYFISGNGIRLKIYGLRLIEDISGYSKVITSEYAPIKTIDFTTSIPNSDVSAFLDTGKNKFWETVKPFPHWVQIDFEEEGKKKSYSLKTGIHGVDSTMRMPKEWLLQGSNDKINWVVLDKRANQINWTNNEKRKYNIKSPGKYKYYRLYFTKGNSDVLRIYGINILN